MLAQLFLSAAPAGQVIERGNAIIGVRYSHAFGPGIISVIGYGTIAVIKPSDSTS